MTGRDPRTGKSLSLEIRDGIITAITEIESDDPAYLSPGLVDLQVNGFQGLDFNDDHLTPATVIDLCHRILATGTTTFLPTIITASEAKITHCLQAIAEARRQDPLATKMIPGIHIEGPHLSPLDGPRGAHPLDHIRPPSTQEFDRWQQACSNLVRLVTLSPHYDESPAYTRALRAKNTIVSIGHTHATPAQILATVDAGATLSTHLGNGVAGILPRHPNLLWTQLAEDRLTAMFIADGHHLPADTLKSMLRAKTLDRAILVSDLAALAGLPPGLYHSPVGGEVEVTKDGRLTLPGTPYLAGSTTTLKDAVAHLTANHLPLHEALRLATQNPARHLEQTSALKIGAPANLIRFTHTRGTTLEIQSSNLA